MTNRADPLGWVNHDLADKYRIQQVVGEGGFGLVYRALHLGLQTSVAVKCLKVPSNLSPADRHQFEAAFFNEGKLLHQLSRATAGIAQSLDLGTATSPSGQWTPYIVLEWLEGRSLREEIDARRSQGKAIWSVVEAFELLAPAIDALAEAHAQGVAHRDVKPANLFLARVGGHIKVKVLDFGIAKMMGESTTLTRALEQTGDSIKAFSPRYGAPEQFRSTRGATGPWTDVFGLALIYVELITGRPALDGKDAVQLFVASGDPTSRPTPRSRGFQVSDGLEAVLRRALAVAPRERYLSAEEFSAALKAAVQDHATSVSAPAAPFPSAVRPQATWPMPNDKATQASEQSALTSVGQTQSSTTSAHVSPAQNSQRVPTSQGKSPVAWLALGAGGLVAVAIGVGVLAAVIVFVVQLQSDGKSVPPKVSASPRSSETVAAPGRPGQEVLVTAGMFRMGVDGVAGYAERPAHTVTISRAFYIDTTEVTVDAYQCCVRAGVCQKTPDSGIVGRKPNAGGSTDRAKCNASVAGRGQHPVDCVTHEQAAAFCKWVHKRLPTEAEWEYAARGNGSGAFPWGSSPPSCDMLVVDRGPAGACHSLGFSTSPVGTHPTTKTPFGALDMAGNVSEWVADAYATYAYKRGDQRDPLYAMTPGPKRGVVRGGSFTSTWRDASAWRRLPVDPGVVSVSIGFRCVRDKR